MPETTRTRSRAGRPRRAGRRATAASLAFALVAILLPAGPAGCARAPEGPLLRDLRDGEPDRIVSLMSARGGRDGASVTVRYVFAAPEKERLVVDLSVVADPQPRLLRGLWRFETASGDANGYVRADSLLFLGGQGGQPALGGDLVLLDGGADRYRLLIPPFPIESGPPGGDEEPAGS